MAIIVDLSADSIYKISPNLWGRSAAVWESTTLLSCAPGVASVSFCCRSLPALSPRRSGGSRDLEREFHSGIVVADGSQEGVSIVGYGTASLPPFESAEGGLTGVYDGKPGIGRESPASRLKRGVSASDISVALNMIILCGALIFLLVAIYRNPADRH